MDLTGMELKSVQPDLLAGDEKKLREALKFPGGSADKGHKGARKVAREFESIFVGMMLKSMRDTVGEDQLMGGGHAEEMYRSLLDEEYAKAVAERGTLGLAGMVEKELLKGNGQGMTNPDHADSGVRLTTTENVK